MSRAGSGGGGGANNNRNGGNQNKRTHRPLHTQSRETLCHAMYKCAMWLDGRIFQIILCWSSSSLLVVTALS
jgi:hypothetical protein